jgi:Lysylphosphatidylglycerol synthase TM region
VLMIPILLRRSPGRSRPAWFVHLAAGIGLARQSLHQPNWRLIGAVGYLGFDIAALGATFAAAGKPLPIAALILGYLIGYLANIIPVPGGFGVLEGGLAGTLIAYGAPPTQAAAAVIVYHAIAFWIPTLGGVTGYMMLRRRLDRQQHTPPATERRPAAQPSPQTSRSPHSLSARRPQSQTPRPTHP